MKALSGTQTMNRVTPPACTVAFMGTVREIVLAANEILLLADYDLSHYERDLFSHFGVPLPSALVNAVAKRQADYLAGRILAIVALKMMGMPPVAPSIASCGVPCWQKGVRGSISHSHGCVGVWVTGASFHPGLDIETLATANQIKAIRQVVLTDKERAMALDGPALTAVFSGKEAIYKALFPLVGYRFGFDCAELTDPPNGGRATYLITKSLCPTVLKGLVLEVSNDWMGNKVLSRCRARVLSH